MRILDIRFLRDGKDVWFSTEIAYRVSYATIIDWITGEKVVESTVCYDGPRYLKEQD